MVMVVMTYVWGVYLDFLPTYTHTHTHTHARTDTICHTSAAAIYTFMHARTYSPTYTHTHVHTHTHTHAHRQTQADDYSWTIFTPCHSVMAESVSTHRFLLSACHQSEHSQSSIVCRLHNLTCKRKHDP